MVLKTVTFKDISEHILSQAKLIDFPLGNKSYNQL